MKTIILSACALLTPACLSAASDGDTDDAIEDASSDGKTDNALTWSQGVFALHAANNASLDELIEQVGLTRRAASNLIGARAGRDQRLDTDDDVWFTSGAQLDAVPWIGPRSMLALANHSEAALASGPTLEFELVVDEFTEDGDRRVRLADLNRELEGRLPAFPDRVSVGPTATDVIPDLRAQIERAGELLGRQFHFEFGANPDQYQGLCYRGELSLVPLAIHAHRGGLIDADLGVQAERYRNRAIVYLDRSHFEGEADSWADWQRDSNGNEAAIETWEEFSPSSDAYLLMSDYGQNGDGLELVSTHIPRCR